MTWISNAKFPLPPEAGTVFHLKDESKVTIHHYVGCGEAWFLSVPALGFDAEDLKTEYFDEAVANAQVAIGNRLATMMIRFMPIVSDKTEISLTK